MNSDIRLSVGFWQHPKTKKLVKRLGLEGIRSLQILWCWVAQNKADGQLTSMDWEDIELAADWQGEEGKFFQHCLGVWIDEVEGTFVLHDWKQHNPWQAEAMARSEQARQNAKSGWEKKRAMQAQENGNATEKQMQSDGNAENMQLQCDGNAAALQAHANGNAPSPSPSPKDIKNIKEAKASFVGKGLPPKGEAGNQPCGQDTGKGPQTGQLAAPDRAREPPNCPHERIIELYHEHLPELSRVKVWEGSRRSNLQARWREGWKQGKYRTQDEGLAYWEKLFKYVRNCPWLMGHVAQRNGNAFRASLDWMVLPNNFAKIIEGRYEPRAA